MKIQIYSDLHIEFAAFNPPATDADLVVLAGDIGVGAATLQWAAEAFPDKPVVYVLGNHEFYGSSLVTTRVAMDRACPANVHLLENQAIVIGGVRLLGCTLWTDYELFGPSTRSDAMAAAGDCLADHRCITINELEQFQPSDALAQHRASRAWLAQQLKQTHAGPTVVITHHGPHRGSLSPQYAHDIVSAGFISDLGPLMGSAALWIHGHTHTSFDYEVDGTRVVCNPRGYPLNTGAFENSEFDAALVLQV